MDGGNGQKDSSKMGVDRLAGGDTPRGLREREEEREGGREELEKDW